jgi:hypothetical protein
LPEEEENDESSQDSRSAEQYLNPQPSEYEAGMLDTTVVFCDQSVDEITVFRNTGEFLDRLNNSQLLN